MIRHGECLPLPVSSRFADTVCKQRPLFLRKSYYYGGNRARIKRSPVARIPSIESTHVPQHSSGNYLLDTCTHTRNVPLRRVQRHTKHFPTTTQREDGLGGGGEGGDGGGGEIENVRNGRSGTRTTGSREKIYKGEYLTVVAMLPESCPRTNGKICGKELPSRSREPRSRRNTARVRNAIGDRDRRNRLSWSPSLGHPTGQLDPPLGSLRPADDDEGMSADSRLVRPCPRLPTQIACY